jgi:hypothetical protein
VLERLFPQIRPDVLNPQVNTGRATENATHDYLFYTKNAFRVYGFTEKEIVLDNAFHDIARSMQQDSSLGFSIRLRPDAYTVVATLPYHFPLFAEPAGDRKQEEFITRRVNLGLPVGVSLSDYTHWDYRVDSQTGETVSAVRTLDVIWPDIVGQNNIINGAFNAATASAVINIQGWGMTDERKKQIYEVIGYMPYARRFDASYESFKKGMERFYDWFRQGNYMKAYLLTLLLYSFQHLVN